MAGLIDIPIVGQSYHLKDWAIDCQKTVNLYPQAVESGNTPQVSALLCTPGLIKRFDLGGKIRGIYTHSGYVYVVAGNKLYSINKADDVYEIGIIDGENLVVFADNSLQLMISSDSLYYYDISKRKLLIVEGEEFFGASDVTFLDSRFVWTVPNSGRIQWSQLLTQKTDALSYATAEAKSDNIVRAVANNGQLWLIGEKTTEIWNSTGSSDMPFSRMSGAFIPTGCVAKNSVCQFGGSLIWLTQTDHGQSQIVVTQGYQVSRISNHAIETEISSYSRVDDAYTFAYQQDGHAFFMITFPTAQKTWCYDSTTQMWHERSFYNKETFSPEHHRASTHCFFNGEHLVGDRENGLIYRLCNDSQTDNGATIVRERTTPVINPHGQFITFDELEIKIQTGQETDSKPLIMLDWSDNSGRTWSTVFEHDLGGLGDFNKRVIFRRLGRSLNRVFRLRMTDASKLIVLGAKARVR